MSYDFDHYSGRHLKYPTKPTKPTLERNPSSIEARAFADALEEYERKCRSYEEDKSYYQFQMAVLHREFADKLKADYGMGDAEFDTIWGEAYDRGHSGGLEEVFNEFDRLYDFVNKYTSIMMMRG
jgi:hypothetical protein